MVFTRLFHTSGSPAKRSTPKLGRLGFVVLSALLAAACGTGPEPTPKPAEPAPQIDEADTEAPVPMRPESGEQEEQQMEETPSEDAATSSSTDTSQSQPSSGPAAGEVSYSDTVWAPGDEGVLMKGLDGGLYEPYLPSVIEQVQRQLQPEFYDGPVTGVLDKKTMQAIGEYQDQTNLQVSGVPSPNTRKRLFAQGG